MRIPTAPVKTIPQPPLLPLPATSVVLEVLVDREDGTAVISVFSTDPINGGLVALVSRPIDDLGKLDAEVREMGREFTEQLHFASGPF